MVELLLVVWLIWLLLLGPVVIMLPPPFVAAGVLALAVLVFEMFAVAATAFAFEASPDVAPPPVVLPETFAEPVLAPWLAVALAPTVLLLVLVELLLFVSV